MGAETMEELGEDDPIATRTATAVMTLVVAGLMITAAVPAGTAATDETVSTVEAPEDHEPPAMIDPEPRSLHPLSHERHALASQDWLLIEDNVPWFTDAIPQALNQEDYDWDRITSDELADATLTDYDGVITASDQGSGFYDNLAENKAKIQEYVLTGGTLMANYAQAGWNSYPPNDAQWLPGCTGFEIDYGDSLELVDPDSPIVEGMDEADFQGWGYSTHGYLTDLPVNTNTILQVSGSEEPTFVSYPFGLGTVYTTMQTVEWGWASGDSHQLLLNELAVPHTPAAGLANVAQAQADGCLL